MSPYLPYCSRFDRPVARVNSYTTRINPRAPTLLLSALQGLFHRPGEWPFQQRRALSAKSFKEGWDALRNKNGDRIMSSYLPPQFARIDGLSGQLRIGANSAC